MDYKRLPAVLLAAEFHQRYITSILKPAQDWEKDKLLGGIHKLYQDLYLRRSALFKPLWAVSKVVLKEALARASGTRA